jgi:hypothetical protein
MLLYASLADWVVRAESCVEERVKERDVFKKNLRIFQSPVTTIVDERRAVALPPRIN